MYRGLSLGEAPPTSLGSLLVKNPLNTDGGLEDQQGDLNTSPKASVSSVSPSSVEIFQRQPCG